MSSGRVITRELGQDLEGLLMRPYASHEPRVRDFLRETPALLQTLRDAWPIVQAHFPGTLVALTVIEDPEEPDPAHGRRLVARILSDLPPAEAVAQLHRFDDDWWLTAATSVGDRLTITLG